jgi:GNAT superfamily N-acetyltransferase
VLAIDFLKNRPEHLLTVARWVHDEWTHVTDPDFENQVQVSRGWLNDERIPLCLVALEGERCVGTVSIFVDDLASRQDLTPWLAALYVDAEYRDRGIGGALIERLLAVARGLGIRRLYLHTETASGYYRRKGWRFLFRTVNDRGEQTEVFDLELTPPT